MFKVCDANKASFSRISHQIKHSSTPELEQPAKAA